MPNDNAILNPVNLPRASAEYAYLPAPRQVLKLKQKGFALIYDVGGFDEASVHIRGAAPGTDFTGAVVHIRQSNFEGDKEGEDFASAVSFSAVDGIEAVQTTAKYLIVVVTTAGSGSNDEEAEVAVLARVASERTL